MTLGSLHLDLVRLICEYLDRSHPQSLLAFALTSKRSYDIASGLLFRTIKLTFSDGQQLAKDVHKWQTLLLRESGFAHVRRLLLYWSERQRVNQYLSLHSCERYEDDSRWHTCWKGCPRDFPPMSEGSIANDEWQVLAALVAQLSGLADIFYACPGQFPPCLLQILHEKIPRCRLHHYSFQLRGLERDRIDAHEMALATSPCLHSVGDLNLANDFAVWEFVRRRARNLRRAHIWLANDAVEVEADTTNGAGNRPIPLEVLQVNRPNLPRSELSFGAVCGAAHGDFSALRELRIDVPIADLDLLPAASDFPALTKLSWWCADKAPDAAYWDTLGTFLHSLPCLTALRLREWSRKASVVPALNNNLRKLDICTRPAEVGAVSSADYIHQLAVLCPLLEDLRVEIERSRGDAVEVSLYRSLGRLPRLRRLGLRLHVSLPELDSTVEHLDAAGDSIGRGTTIEPWFDAEDAKTMDNSLRPYRHGHIRGLLTNIAVDSQLARSIFEVIDTAKAGLPGEVQPLQRIETHTLFSLRLPYRRVSPQPFHALSPYVSALYRTWSVERDFADNATLHVREIPAHTRQNSVPSVTRPFAVENLVKRVEEGDEVLKIWRRLWPTTKEGGQWWKDWKSWPLRLENEH